MSRHMIERTTVRLPSDLLNRAKRKAAAERRTLTSLIEEGLQLVVAEKRKPAKRERRPLPLSTAPVRHSQESIYPTRRRCRKWKTSNMSSG